MKPKSGLFLVFLIVVIDLMGFGIVLPLLPFYAARFNATPLMIGLLYSVYSLAQLVFSPYWGALSDRIGRRPIMLLSTFGASLAYILFAFSDTLWLLLASRLLAGIMGGNISTAQAYVADVTTHEERSKGMGLIGAAFGIGFTVGPALAGILTHEPFRGILGLPVYALPGFFAAALSFISFILVWLKLPETVSARKFASPDEDRINASGGVFSTIFWKKLFLEQAEKPVLAALFLCVFLLSISQSSLYSAFPLFYSGTLGLSAEKVGFQFAYMGIIAVLIQGIFIRALTKRFGETRLFLIGTLVMGAGYFLAGAARSEQILLCALTLMAVGGSLNGPTLTSLVSKNAPEHRLGTVLGGSQGLSAMGRVIGPVWGGALFSLSSRLPFAATAFIILGTFFIGLRFKETRA